MRILNTLTLLLTFTGALSAQLINEDFSSGTGSGAAASAPSGWSIVAALGDQSEGWDFDDAESNANTSMLSAIVAPYAIIDSDNGGSNNNLAEDVSLVSPVFTPVAGANVFIDWDEVFRQGFGGAGSVDFSEDGGMSWTTLLSLPAGVGEIAAHRQVWFSSRGQPTQIRFRWTGDWSWWWVIDNVVVTEISMPAYPGTGEDLVLRSGVNFATPTRGPGFDQKDVDTGDVLTIIVDSPTGTFWGLPYTIIASVIDVDGGAVLPVVDFTPFVPAPSGIYAVRMMDVAPPLLPLQSFIAGGADGTQQLFGPVVLAPGGASLTFQLPPGLFGLDLAVQGIHVGMAAQNTFVAGTDVHLFVN